MTKSPAARRASPNATPAFPVAIGLFVVFWLLYHRTGTWAWSYDELCDVLDIEFGPFKHWFHPNHLLHNFIGGVFYWTLRRLGYHGRSIFVLQQMNFVLGGLAVCAAYEAMRRSFGWKRALTGACLLGVTQAFWRGAVDANCYAEAGLISCALVGLLLWEPLFPFLEGLALGAAILFHEMFIFAVPAFYIRWEEGERFRYVLGIILAGILPYIALAAVFHHSSFHEMLYWLLAPAGFGPRNSIGSGSFWSLHPGASIRDSWYALSTSLTADTGIPTLSAVWSLVWAVSLLALVIDALPRWKAGKLDEGIRSLWIWVVTMSVFQFFWQPGAMRFRTLILPALVALGLDALKRFRSKLVVIGLAVLACLVGLNNAQSVFLPESHLENNSDLLRTVWVAESLAAGDCFFFSGVGSGSVTNVCLAYFAPHLAGRSMKGFLASELNPNLNELTAMAKERIKAGHRVFFDVDLLNPLSQERLEADSNLPRGTIHRWVETFQFYRPHEGPLGYRIIEAEIR